MSLLFIRYKFFFFFSALLFQPGIVKSQTNLLLNGGFEDVNICTEYNSECGVEGWFYLKDVKAQMLDNDSSSQKLGSNSYGIYFNWLGYKDFSPVIGTILPCGLQKDKQYTFKGIISAKLNPRLILKPGICIGEKFYVPKRPFAKNLQPDSILLMKPIPKTNFYEFEYSFIATGNEKYLTFGTYIEEDTVTGKKNLTGTQTVSLMLDNFQLTSEDVNEIVCPAFKINKEKVYSYNYRHKEMDYSLYGKGEVAIVFNSADSNFITKIKTPEPPAKADTLKLGDVFFDFNKANLKPTALTMLAKYFLNNKADNIDSIYIEGHTDSIGSDKRNLELSLLRCNAVKDWLVLNSVVDADKLTVLPFGKSRPIATNSTATGRAMNRRVEMIIFRETVSR